MATPNSFRWRLRDRLVAGREGMVRSPWSWRTFALACLMPVRAARFYREVFARWACVPGDVFEDFQMDRVFVVRRVARASLDIHPVANEFLARPVPGAIVDTITVPRGDSYRWVHVNDRRAAAARDLVGWC